jgi:hypothetical protein
MEQHKPWKKMGEARIKRLNETSAEDSGSEITIHMEDIIWYPQYF